MRARRTGEFWIACDFCDVWYDGKCVQVRRPRLPQRSACCCPNIGLAFCVFWRLLACLPADLTLFSLAASACWGCCLAFIAFSAFLERLYVGC